MRFYTLMLPVLAIMFFAACGPQTETTAPAPQEPTDTVAAEPVATLDTAALIEQINARRTSIESNLSKLTLVEVGADKLREKTRQKWSKIHFYKEGDAVVRIKSYPHATVSKRTEEFYFDNGQLTMVVVEDNGSGDRGKPVTDLDRVYYFHNGNAIVESTKKEVEEYGTLKAEGEELLSEAAEYLELLKTK